MRRFALVLVMLFPLAASGEVDRPYLESLIAKARALGLAERPEWHKLVHYMPNLVMPGVHSLVDSPDFFNSPRGKTDPQAELEATLESFYSEREETDTQQNPQCRFVARRAWLDEQLGFDRQRLRERPCKRYEDWRASLNAAGLTLIFASGYLNSPGTMYGHTLLRVDAKDQDERTRLLAYAINFAAVTNERSGLAFAVNGLLGGYPGAFSILPYYIKVREYSDMENRDIWEYELDLSPQEVDRVLRHAWEMGPSWFWYFFFDENCSYQLNALIQVARPELDLVSPFRWWALPTDTVRVVTDWPGLVKKVVYRPANATLISNRLNHMSADERRAAKELSQGASPAGVRDRSAAAQARTLETAHDYVEYRRAIGKHDVPDSARLARELLLERAALAAPSQAPAIVPPERPDEGHGTARIGIGAGRHAGRDYAELRLRPVYHDILDPQPGYARGAQIEFFNTEVRHYSDGGTRLQEFTPVDILSLTPRDQFFETWSWKVGAGWKRAFLRDGSEPLVTGVDGGGGAAWSVAGDRALLYALFDGAGRLQSGLDHGYAVGAGPELGALVDVGPRWRLHAQFRALRYFLGDQDTQRSWLLEQRFTLTRGLALRLDLARERAFDRTLNRGVLSLLIYL